MLFIKKYKKIIILVFFSLFVAVLFYDGQLLNSQVKPSIENPREGSKERAGGQYSGKILAVKNFVKDKNNPVEILFGAKDRAEADKLGLLNMKKFKTGDYRNTYLFFPEHINYVDSATGEVKEADPVFDPQPDGTFQMTRASYFAQAPAFSDEPLLFRFDGANITFTALHLNTTTVSHVAGTRDGTKIVYPDAFGHGIDYVIQAEPGELRKLVIFKSKPEGADDIRIEFKTSLKEKEIIKGRNTKIGLAFFREPKVWDSSGISEPITVELDNEVMTKILPRSFFDRAPDAPLLSYPVTTDLSTSYYAGAGDGYVHYNVASQSWATAHDDDGTNATADYTSSTGIVGSQQNSGGAKMQRAFFPVNTSGIADNDEITAARLKIYATATTNGVNDGNDYLVVVQTTQASTASLVIGDYDQCGSVSNPTAGSATLDITSVSTSAYNTLTLNSTGEGWISKTGTTQLGLREGHDALNTAPGGSSNPNNVTFSTSEATGTTQDPYLEVDTIIAVISSVTTQRTIFATSTANVIVSSSITGETAASSTLEYVLFLDEDADATPDTNETYVTGDCAGSAQWSSGMYTYIKSNFTIADGESPKTHSWECANTNFPENGLYTIYLTWKDANGTIDTDSATTFQSCNQPTGNNSWWDTNFENRALISFRSATFSEAMIDFPVMVKATSTNQILDDIESSGNDVRFIDENNGTMLNFEKEYVDATTTKEAYWWVQVPKIATSTDCDFVMMYYDQTATTSRATTTGVWRQDYYEAVWHFGETASTTDYLMRDGEASYAGTADALIDENNTTMNYGGTKTCSADSQWGASLLRAVCLTKFDVSSIPSSCVVSAASLTVFISNQTANTFEIYEMLRSWTEGTKASSTTAVDGTTWNTYDGTNNWATAGALGAADKNSTTFGSFAPSTLDVFNTTTLNSTGIGVVQGWIDGTNSNEGMWLGPGDNNETDGLWWKSSEDETVAKRPKLTVSCGNNATYLDSTLNNHDETNSTVASRAEKGQSKFGYSPKLAGTIGTGIGIPDSAGFDVTSYTLTGWFRRDGTGDSATFSKLQTLEPFIGKGYAEADTIAADIQFSVGYNTSGQSTLGANWEDDRHATGNDWSHLGGTTISNSQWYHFGFRLKDKAIANLYLDGFVNNTTTYNINQGASTGGTMKLGIGTVYNTSATADGGWNGYLDEIRVYKVALATTTASNDSAWLRAEWFTADNGYVVWDTEATTSGSALSITASSTLAFSTITYSFFSQTSTATNVGGTYVAGGGGTWTMNVSCMDSPSDCMWKGATEKDRFSMFKGASVGGTASTSGIMCFDWSQLSCGASPCTGVTLSSGYQCFPSTKADVTMATGSGASGTYWFAESDWAQAVPGMTTSSVYTSTLIWDLAKAIDNSS